MERLQKTLEIVHNKRVEYTQNTLDEVASEYNRLYKKIHPNESLGDLKLLLDPEKRGSLFQKAQFEGYEDILPQAYFSESHLDTLGFCVWLAIAKRDCPQDSIIVLDDIFTSIDSVHLKRIVSLLTEESEKFCQVIITTHYRNWRDRYRRMQSANRSVQLIELWKWSLEKGIRTYTTKIEVDELEVLLSAEPFDRQGVASKAGIFLESILDNMALQYGCKTRHTRDNDYSLKELMDSCSKIFKRMQVGFDMPDPPSDHNSEEEDIPNHSVIFVKLHDSSFVRNQVGCHYSIAGSDISDSEVEEFGKDVLDLAKGVTCQHCGTIPCRGKDPTFECPCGYKKLTLL
jgi:AAA domain, putative AbiEii toxin, Type IV TA system